MKYFDPSRPRICDRPAYVFDGAAVAPIPVFGITPTADGEYLVEFCLLRSGGGASWYERTVGYYELLILLSKWEDEPEAVLADFGWCWREPAQAPEAGSASLSLEDLE